MTLYQLISTLSTDNITVTVKDDNKTVIVFCYGYEAVKTEISERIVESWEIVKSTEIVVTLAEIQP